MGFDPSKYEGLDTKGGDFDPSKYEGLEETSSGFDPSKYTTEPGTIQKAAQFLDTPSRGIRGLVVGLEQLAQVPFTDKTLSQAAQTASEATKVGYVPKGIGQKAATFAAGMVDPYGIGFGGLGRKLAMKAGLGLLARGALEGATAGVGTTAMTGFAEEGKVDPKTLAISGVMGAGLGAAAEKVGSVLVKRAAKKAEAQAAKETAEATARTIEQLEVQKTNAESIRNILKKRKDALEAPTQARISEIEKRIGELEQVAIPEAKAKARAAREAQIGESLTPLKESVSQQKADIEANRKLKDVRIVEGWDRADSPAYQQASKVFDSTPQGQMLLKYKSSLQDAEAGLGFDDAEKLRGEVQLLESYRNRFLARRAKDAGFKIEEQNVRTDRLSELEGRIEGMLRSYSGGIPSPEEVAAKREALALRDELRMRYKMLSRIEDSPVGMGYRKMEGRASDLRMAIERARKSGGKNAIGARPPESPLVKVLFKQKGKAPESMWVRVVRKNPDGTIDGILDNEPVSVDMKLGQSVKFNESEIIRTYPEGPQMGLGAKVAPEQAKVEVKPKVPPEGPSPAKQEAPKQAELPGILPPEAEQSALPGFETLDQAASRPIEKVNPRGEVIIDPEPVMARVAKNDEEIGKKYLKALENKDLDAVVGSYRYQTEAKYRINQLLADFVEQKGEVGKRMALSILDENGVQIYKDIEALPPKQFAEEIRRSSTKAGEILNRLSQVSKAMKKMMEAAEEATDDDIAKALTELLNKDGQRPLSEGLRGMTSFGRDAIDAWRGFLTATFGTAARNIMTQGARVSVGMMDNYINGMIQRHWYKVPKKQAFASVNSDWFALIQHFSNPRYRGKIQKLIETLEPFGADRLGSNPLSDLNFKSRTKAGRVLTWSARKANELVGNTLQENFFRRMAFDARLRSSLTKLGFTLDDITKLKPEQIRTLVDDAVDHALTMTFAASPKKGTAGSAILNAYHKMPIGYVLLNPFPRFWYNAMKFSMDYSPFGFMFNKYAGKNVEQLASGISKTFVGTMLWSAAVATRASDFAGEKWYEVKPQPNKKPNLYMDTRNFNPYATQLFLAEFLKRFIEKRNGERVDYGFTTDEIANAVFALRRSDFSGLPFLDNVIFNKSEMTESWPKIVETVEKMFGDFLGGFTVPIKSIRDIAGGMEPINVKSVQQSPILAPTLSNIPIARNVLPDEPSPTQSKPRQYEAPIIRQAGLTFSHKSPFQAALDKHDISQTMLSARLGDPDLNDEGTKWVGKLLEAIMNPMVENPTYKKLGRYEQKWFIEMMIGELRPIALDIAKDLNPQLTTPMMIRALGDLLPIPAKKKLQVEALKLLNQAKGKRLP